MIRTTIGLALAAALPIMLSACGTTTTEQLDQARAAYERAENDPEVSRSAPGELRQSRDELSAAEQLAESRESETLIDHRAYLAELYALIAAEHAQTSRLQQDIEEMEERREQIERERRAAEADQLRQQLEEMEAEETERGMVLTLGDVLFETGQADMGEAGLSTVGRLADLMEEHPNRRVRIEGHTDSVGDPDFNQRLSERRAQSVRNALIEEGISGERIEIRGYGENYPVATNDTPENRQRNRRVEVIISDGDGNIRDR